LTESTPDHLLAQVDQHVATLTLNRPAQFNALTEPMLLAALQQVKTWSADPTVRVIVIAANGAAFCAGHDLKQMQAAHDLQAHQKLFTLCSSWMQALANAPQPVIAKVQGMATAAGCQLVAQADLAVAAEGAKFAVSGVSLGLFCSTPSVPLTRNVLPKQAFEMLVTGDFIDAHTALRYGLVNHVVPVQQLGARVEALCATIIQKPRVAIEAGKKLFYAQRHLGLASAYQMASHTMACNMMQEPTVEGIAAFIEKRPPNWKS
jgi:enoyl-CoA hydratase/carnithine racemase